MFEGKKDDPVNKTTWIPESFTRALEEYAASQNILLNRRIIQYCQYAMAHRKKTIPPRKIDLFFSQYVNLVLKEHLQKGVLNLRIVTRRFLFLLFKVLVNNFHQDLLYSPCFYS